MKLLFVVLVSPLAAFAESKSKTIPFVYETTAIIEASDQILRHSAQFPGEVVMMNQGAGKAKVAKRTTQNSPVEVSQIGDLVSSVHDAICDGIKNGSFKVWLKFDANAKVLGIGTSSEGGIEVNVNCDETGAKTKGKS